MINRFCILLLGAASAVALAADDPTPKAKATAADDVAALLKTLKVKDEKSSDVFYHALGSLNQRLRKGDGAEETAKALFDHLPDFEVGDAAAKRLAEMKDAKKSVAAAELLLQMAKSRKIVTELGRGGVIIGRLVVADGKLEPDLVLAQMPVLADGSFAGEVGDMAKTVAFRAAGYEPLDVALKGKPGDTVDVGTITLKPLAPEQAATLKGVVKLDRPEGDPPTVQLQMAVPKPNTPHNGYSPRARWPEATAATPDKDGAFSVTGLTPSEYYIITKAKDHNALMKRVKLEPGQEKDEGTLRLRCNDMAFYVGKDAPKSEKLAWAKDFPAAMATASADKKPVMLMMTATWCGPCKMLEKETLNDPWVRHFLSAFVPVKAYEDKDVEEKYGANGYPTLVFLDSAGKEVVRTSGFQPPGEFLSHVVKAMEKLSIKLPAELQMLVDKKALSED